MAPLQERLAAIKREQEQEEVRECSFRPAINGRSSRLMSDRSTVLKVPIVSSHTCVENQPAACSGVPFASHAANQIVGWQAA